MFIANVIIYFGKVNWQVLLWMCVSELWQKLGVGESCGSRLSAAWFWNSYTTSIASAADQYTCRWQGNSTTGMWRYLVCSCFLFLFHFFCVLVVYFILFHVCVLLKIAHPVFNISLCAVLQCSEIFTIIDGIAQIAPILHTVENTIIVHTFQDSVMLHVHRQMTWANVFFFSDLAF